MIFGLQNKVKTVRWRHEQIETEIPMKFHYILQESFLDGWRRKILLFETASLIIFFTSCVSLPFLISIIIFKPRLEHISTTSSKVGTFSSEKLSLQREEK